MAPAETAQSAQGLLSHIRGRRGHMKAVLKGTFWGTCGHLWGSEQGSPLVAVLETWQTRAQLPQGLPSEHWDWATGAGPTVKCGFQAGSK